MLLGLELQLFGLLEDFALVWETQQLINIVLLLKKRRREAIHEFA